MPTTYYTPPATCVNLNSNTLILCFDKVDCNPSSTLLLKDCNDLNNCNRCEGDEPYYIPFSEDCPVMFQLKEIDTYNSDPENPTAGWGEWMEVDLCDGNGAVVSSNIDDFTSDHLVGYLDHSFQTISIDTSAVPDCWALKIRILNADGTVNKELCSEPFRKVPDTCNRDKELLCIESDYSNQDCEKNCYQLANTYTGTRNFKYSNKICLLGSLECEPGSITRERSGNTITSTTYQEQFTLRLSCPIPKYMHQYLMSVVLGGKDIKINGEVYEFDTQTPDNQLQNGELYYYSLSFYRDCTISGQGDGNC